MATNSMIFLKVDESNISTILNTDMNSYSISTLLEDGLYPGNLIGIYCHYDGYIVDVVGEELSKNFKSFDKTLSLIKGGNVKSIENGYPDHYNKDIILSVNKALIVKDEEAVLEKFKEDFVYIFENEGWKCITRDSNVLKL